MTNKKEIRDLDFGTEVMVFFLIYQTLKPVNQSALAKFYLLIIF